MVVSGRHPKNVPTGEHGKSTATATAAIAAPNEAQRMIRLAAVPIALEGLVVVVFLYLHLRRALIATEEAQIAQEPVPG